MSLAAEYPVTQRCIGPVQRLAQTPGWIYDLDNPYLHGAYAPTLVEAKCVSKGGAWTPALAGLCVGTCPRPGVGAP